MKSFKQYKKDKDEPKQGIVDKNGVPNAVVMWPVNEERIIREKLSKKHNIIVKEDSGEEDHPDLYEWKKKNDNHHIGEHASDIHANLSVDTHIKPHEKVHITRYTAGSRYLNKAMYDSHVHGKEVPTHVDTGGYDETGPHDVHGLDKALHHKVKEDRHVYTGVKFHPGDSVKNHPEGHLHLPAYTSTSHNKQVADDFAEKMHDGKHILHIHMKKGDKGTYIADHSHFHTEHETVLPRSTTLKVHPKPEVYKDFNGTHTHIWHCTIHHQADLS